MERNKGKMLEEHDRVSEMFKGKSIFITGGSGFVGKTLIEKLLRSCSELDTIYVLIRMKKGKSPNQRIEEIFRSPLFDTLRKSNPEAIKKLKAIPGDVEHADLAMSAEDRALLAERVHIVYHCAATIRFDEPLKKAVLLNTRGTKLILELAEQFKNLLAFVHVSTAYCHLHISVLHEELYDPPGDPLEIIHTAEVMTESEMSSVEKIILGNVTNSYVYTKALSESLVAEKMKTMPCMITRPSIVLPIWKGPLPGWTDNINGPVGLLIGAGKGVIRTMFANDKMYADFIPADFACNSLLLATWDFVCNKDMNKRIYNITTSSEIKITWSQIIEMGRKLLLKFPVNGVAWYPGGSMKSSRLAHNIALLFTHWIPAYAVDGLLVLAGRKTFMVRLQHRITKGLEVFEYFATNQWDFMNENFKNLRQLQNEKEKEIYPITCSDFEFDSYFGECIKSARIYILKEMPETIPAARRHMTMMYWIDVIVKVLFWYMMYSMLVSYSETARNVSDSVFGYVKSFVPPAIMSSDG